MEIERAISGIGVTRIMERLAATRGLPRVIRSGHGKEFCGKAPGTRARSAAVPDRAWQPF